MLQIDMLRYITSEFDVVPSFVLEEEQMKRYTARLTAGSDTHVTVVDPPSDEALTQSILINVANLGTAYRNPSSSFVSRGSAGMATNLLERVLEKESQILDMDYPWRDWGEKPNPSFDERRAARVTSGKASYLYLYGRNKKPTGSAAFDGMYQAMWTIAERALSDAWSDPVLTATVGRHERFLRRAEVHHIGHVVLAPRLEEAA